MRFVGDRRLLTITYEDVVDASTSTLVGLGDSWPPELDFELSAGEQRAMAEHKKLCDELSRGYFGHYWHWEFFGGDVYDRFKNQEGHRHLAFRRSISLVLFHYLTCHIIQRTYVVEFRKTKPGGDCYPIARLRMGVIKLLVKFLNRKYMKPNYARKCLAEQMALGDKFREVFDASIYLLGGRGGMDAEDNPGFWLCRSEAGEFDFTAVRYLKMVRDLDEVCCDELGYFFPK